MRGAVVVTGASGFVGQRLVARLGAEGVAVHAVCRRDVEVPGATAVHLVRDYGQTPAIADAVLVHLAGERSLAAAESRGASGVAEAAGAARALVGNGYRGLIVASSAVVYGDKSPDPHRPDEVVHPQNRYAEAKLSCEAAFVQAGGLAMRLGNVYGPGMAPESVVAEIVAQIPGDGPVRIRDAGPIRDFVWIDDVIEAFVAAARRPQAGILNVGSGQGVSIGALAATALKVAGAERRLVVSARLPPGRPSACLLDVQETRSKLGWRAVTPLAAGLGILVSEGRA